MNCPVSLGVGPGVGACTARSIPALMLPHQPAPPHPTHNSITSTTSRNVIVEDPALVERKVPPRCPDLPRKPDLPRSFRRPAYHRTLAYHDAHRRHRGTKGASTQERAQSTISPAGTIRGALRYPAFGRLLSALAVSQLGDWLYNLTLVALVYSRALGAVGRRHHRGAGGGRRHHVSTVYGTQIVLLLLVSRRVGSEARVRLGGGFMHRARRLGGPGGDTGYHPGQLEEADPSPAPAPRATEGGEPRTTLV